MQTMFWRSNWRYLTVLVFALGTVANACAGSALPWVANENGCAYLNMNDGGVFRVKLSPRVSGVFYDMEKHAIASALYVSLLEVSPSNAVNPLGGCGAGSEIKLQVYKINGANLELAENVLVSSCLRSISLSSQNSGSKHQDSDFSSVQWNEHGFSIDWFSYVNAAGRPSNRTDYVLQGDEFLPEETLSQDVQTQ